MGEPQRETVLGIDNIPLELPVAGIGSRALAAVLDYLTLGLVLAVTVAGILAALGGEEGVSGLGVAVASLVAFALQWGYFAAFEIKLDGRTPGKAAVGLRVVHRDGGAARPGSLVVRNMLRAVDLLTAPPMIAFDPLSRRLGDWLGSTLVIHSRRRPETILGRVPASWGRDEVAVAERLVERSAELKPERAAELAQRLLAVIEHDEPQWLAEHAGLSQADPVEALERLLGVEPKPRPGSPRDRGPGAGAPPAEPPSAAAGEATPPPEPPRQRPAEPGA